MWQRFTERARRVILLGQEEAGKMGSEHVGTEHLLLGLIREDECVAVKVLQKMGLSLEKVRQEIAAEAEPGEDGGTEPKLTPKAKRVLELAADEARRMRHNYIGTEHLLLALLREKDGLAAKVLRKMGLNLEKVRGQVVEYLGLEGSYEPQITAQVQRVLELASDEAMRMQHDYIGTGHLLLGLLLQEDEAAAKVLQELGISLERARAAVIEHIKANDS